MNLFYYVWSILSTPFTKKINSYLLHILEYSINKYSLKKKYNIEINYYIRGKIYMI